jgi:hypothetical protein
LLVAEKIGKTVPWARATRMFFAPSCSQ